MRIRIAKSQVVFLLASLLMLMATPVRARQWTSVEHMDSAYSAYPYVRFVEFGDTLGMSDEDFFDIAGKVVFPVSQYRLNPADPFLRELDQVVLPEINRDSLQLVQLIIRGAASPEGPVSVNERLGNQRAEALFSFIQSRLAFPISGKSFKLDVDIEDYSTLCLMMRRANDPDYDYVKSLVDSYEASGQTAQLKRKLQTARGGQLWRRLLNEYFPGLRSARIVLVFRRYVPEEPEPVIVEPEPAVPQLEPVVVDPQPLVVDEPVVAVEPVVVAVPDTVQEPVLIPRREFLSVKTNLLFYGVYMPGGYDRWCPIPNVAVEYYPKKGHFTFGGSFDFPWWQDYEAHKYFQIRNYQVETRYYLRPSAPYSNTPTASGTRDCAFRGVYLQAYAHLGLFGICFDADRGWVGEGIGGGVGAGYVIGLTRNRHWRLEFGLQVGFYHCKYDPYQYENPVDPNYRDHLYYYKWTQDPSLFKKRQYRWNWLGPTRVGITLTYDLLYRRVQKKGVSFINHEWK